MPAKTKASQRKLDNLRDAIDGHEWNKVLQIISGLPLANPASGASLRVLNDALTVTRVSAELLTEAVDPAISFNEAWQTRQHLLQDATLPNWISGALHAFDCDPNVCDRLAVLLMHLCVGDSARSAVGKAGAVDALAEAWRRRPDSLPIARALTSATSSHIDNLSRCMRRRAVATATKLLAECLKGAENTYSTTIPLNKLPVLRAAAHIAAQCAICQPDLREEAVQLVPALQGCLHSAVETGRPAHALLGHILMAFTTIAETQVKDKTGYELGDKIALLQDVVLAWRSAAESPFVTRAASNALAAFIVPGLFDWSSVSIVKDDILQLAGGAQKLKSAAAVKDMVTFMQAPSKRISPRLRPFTPVSVPSPPPIQKTGSTTHLTGTAQQHRLTPAFENHNPVMQLLHDPLVACQPSMTETTSIVHLSPSVQHSQHSDIQAGASQETVLQTRRSPRFHFSSVPSSPNLETAEQQPLVQVRTSPRLNLTSFLPPPPELHGAGNLDLSEVGELQRNADEGPTALLQEDEEHIDPLAQRHLPSSYTPIDDENACDVTDTGEALYFDGHEDPDATLPDGLPLADDTQSVDSSLVSDVPLGSRHKRNFCETSPGKPSNRKRPRSPPTTEKRTEHENPPPRKSRRLMDRKSVEVVDLTSEPGEEHEAPVDREGDQDVVLAGFRLLERVRNNVAKG